MKALITGASSGIGRDIAKILSKKGYDLALVSRDEEKLQNVKRELEKNNVKIEIYAMDLSIEENCKNLHKKVKNIDILINNAGISIVGLFQELTRQEWDRIFNVNTGSLYNCCHFAVPDMIHNHCGKIINISSVWGVCGASCEVAYSATKGAVNAFTKALAKELAPSNIQVNAIACGAIDTDMNKFLTEDDMNSLIEEIPAGRLGSGEDVANLIYRLATEHDYLTGQAS